MGPRAADDPGSDWSGTVRGCPSSSRSKESLGWSNRTGPVPVWGEVNGPWVFLQASHWSRFQWIGLIIWWRGCTEPTGVFHWDAAPSSQENLDKVKSPERWAESSPVWNWRHCDALSTLLYFRANVGNPWWRQLAVDKSKAGRELKGAAPRDS